MVTTTYTLISALVGDRIGVDGAVELSEPDCPIKPWDLPPDARRWVHSQGWSASAPDQLVYVVRGDIAAPAGFPTLVVTLQRPTLPPVGDIDIEGQACPNNACEHWLYEHDERGCIHCPCAIAGQPDTPAVRQ